MIVPAGMQAIEVGEAVDTEQHGLAIDHKRAVPVSKCGLRYQRKAAAPVVAVAVNSRTRWPSR